MKIFCAMVILLSSISSFALDQSCEQAIDAFAKASEAVGGSKIRLKDFNKDNYREDKAYSLQLLQINIHHDEVEAGQLRAIMMNACNL